MTDPTLLVAFAAGVLSLVSPCSALLLPAFFAYAFGSPVTLLARTTVFYAGLLLTLLPLGVGGSVASRVFYGHRSTLITVSGSVIIVLGILSMLGRGFRLPFTARLERLAGPLTSGTGWASTLALGAVYGLAGFCSGPILGSILTVAATRSSTTTAALLLASYGLGMAAPLFLMAVLWDRYELSRRSWLRGRGIAVGRLRLHTTSLLSGLLFVTIGVVFIVSRGTTSLSGVLGPGDTTGFEMDAQRWLNDNLGSVPAWVIAASVAVVASIVALWQMVGTRRGDARDGGRGPGGPTDAVDERPGPAERNPTGAPVGTTAWDHGSDGG